MPRIETVVSIFVASPGDVSEERDRLQEVISEWNTTWSRQHGIRLELVRWETNAYPGVGEDGQAVINAQIPPDYDIFVGIMWTRFGTPTKRAESGTEEEFITALQKHRADPKSLQILFYFKEAAVKPHSLDVDQLLKVRQFQKRISEEGVLYWRFENTDEFGKSVNLHLSRAVQDFLARKTIAKEDSEQTQRLQDARHSVSVETREVSSGGAAAHDQLVDDGLFDYIETFSRRTDELTEIANRLSFAQEELNNRIQQRTQEIEALAANSTPVSTPHAKRVLFNVAEDMSAFSNRLNSEVPLFHEAIDACIGALTNIVVISREISPADSFDALEAAQTLQKALAGARNSMAGFRQSTDALPRMSKEVNIAKREQTAAIDRIVAEFDNADRLLLAAISVISDRDN